MDLLIRVEKEEEETMKKVLVLMSLFVCTAVFAAAPDPGYLKAFGAGSVAVSVGGYPELGKYDPAQFQFTDGKFLVPGGDDAKLDLRAFLPNGITIGKALAKTKKTRGANYKYQQADFMAFRIWAPSEQPGAGSAVWPAKPTDVPAWRPKVEQTYDITAESSSWVSAGARWDEFKADLTCLKNAKNGQQFYVVFSVGYRYKIPGGQMESKWDDVLHKFVQVKSLGLLGFEYGEPLAVARVEVQNTMSTAARYKATADGTVTDTKSGLIWQKAPSTEGLTFHNVPAVLAKLGGGWRLPSRAELNGLRKGAGDKPVNWLNANGFKGVQADCYWTSEKDGAGRPYVICMNQGAGDAPVMNKEDTGFLWALRDK